MKGILYRVDLKQWIMTVVKINATKAWRQAETDLTLKIVEIDWNQFLLNGRQTNILENFQR